MSQFSRIKLKKKRLPALVCGVALFGLIGFSSCSNVTDTSTPTEYVEETQAVGYTQGLITHLEEVEEGVFKIADETIAPTKADTRVITTYLNGSIDTLTLEQITAMNVAEKAAANTTEGEGNNTTTNNHYHHGSGMNSVLMGGMMGYFMGRSLSSPTNPSAYKNTSAYNKSKATNSSAFKSRSKTTTVKKPSTVRKPATGKSGYGSGKSTRSYGG